MSDDKPGFIVPPPGLIPLAPAEASETIRMTQRPELPTFVPATPGTLPPPTVVPPTPVVVTPAAAPVVHETTQAAQWNLTMHDGSVMRISGTLLLGRDPSRVEGWPTAGLMKVNDPEKTVSKTHAAIDGTGDELVVVDLDSTNGVAIVSAAGETTVLQPGMRTVVPPGVSLELGRYRMLVGRR